MSAHGDEIWVSGYITGEGVHVSGHWRTRTRPTRATSTTKSTASPESAPVSSPVAQQAESHRAGKVKAGMAHVARMRAGSPPEADSLSANPETGDAGEGQQRCTICGQYTTAAGAHMCPGPADGMPNADYAGMGRDDRLEAMKTDLDTAMQAVMESGHLDAWLDAMASNGLSRWSASNRMLAIMQMQTRGKPITDLHLMGFKQWDNYDRSVTKGAQAVWILAPVTKTVTDEDDDGNETTQKRVVGFKSVPVFDVSDTHGTPLPDSPVPAIDGQATPGTLSGLQDRVEHAGYQYSETTLADCNPKTGAGTFGCTDPAGKRIVVDQRLSEADKASTLSHELGHIHCGHVEAGMDAYRMHRGRMETEAEITSYLVNRSRGMPQHQAEARAPGYIAAWSKGDPQILRTAMDTAVAASTKILDGSWPAS